MIKQRKGWSGDWLTSRAFFAAVLCKNNTNNNNNNNYPFMCQDDYDCLRL